MVERKITIVNPSGLHARPATMVVDFAKDFPGTVEIIRESTTGNLKSILMVLSMGLRQGTEVTLRVCGEGEAAYMDELEQYFFSLEA